MRHWPFAIAFCLAVGFALAVQADAAPPCGKGWRKAEVCTNTTPTPTVSPTPSTTPLPSPTPGPSTTPTPPPTGVYTSSPCLDISGQSNVVIEWLEIGPCPGQANISVYNSTNVTIRNVKLSGGETGISALDSSGIHVDGNVYIRGMTGPFPEGSCVQYDKVQGGTMRGIDCLALPNGPEADLISVYMSHNVLIEGNLAGGNTADSGCAYIVDRSGSGHIIRNNVGFDSVNCIVGVAAGQNIRVEGNRAEDSDGNGQACELLSDGSDNSCIYVWNQGPEPCFNIQILNNQAVDPRPYWNGGNCTNVTESGNSWQ